MAGRDADLAADPVPLALFPQGCVYRGRAIAAVEARGRRWRVAFVGQGLAGVQAAVASGLGIGLLPTDTVAVTHRRLGPAEGFADPEPTELALVARTGRLPEAAGRLARFLADGVGSLLRA